MPVSKDLTGKTFNRLTVIKKADPLKFGKYRWECRCLCGNTTVIVGGKITSGRTKSCGCLQKETAANLKKVHGMAGTRLCRIYHAMKSRCYCPSNTSFKNYGGRGIKICSAWLKNPVDFYTWAKENGYTENLSIDRINNEGDYSPENCRWATVAQQTRNTRASVFICIFGEKICIRDAQTMYGLNEETLKRHLDSKDKLNNYLRSHFKSMNTRLKNTMK